jgi:hypothetical protein
MIVPMLHCLQFATDKDLQLTYKTLKENFKEINRMDAKQYEKYRSSVLNSMRLIYMTVKGLGGLLLM